MTNMVLASDIKTATNTNIERYEWKSLLLSVVDYWFGSRNSFIELVGFVRRCLCLRKSEPCCFLLLLLLLLQHVPLLLLYWGCWQPNSMVHYRHQLDWSVILGTTLRIIVTHIKKKNMNYILIKKKQKRSTEISVNNPVAQRKSIMYLLTYFTWTPLQNIL